MIPQELFMTPLVWKDVPEGPEIAIVPQGEFLMGGVEQDKFVSAVEMPQHRVEIAQTFAMGRTPVTCREWCDLMGSLPPGSPVGLSDDCPVVGVTFSETFEYLRELSTASGETYRLPTEAEWEYACRGGTTTVFPYGVRLEVGDANFLYNERGAPVGYGGVTPVGRFRANPFGLVDLLGNVCEWTADQWHPGYEDAPCDGSAWLTGGKAGCRVIRGGAWDHLPRVLRSSWRDWAPEHVRWDNLGFRVARDL